MRRIAIVVLLFSVAACDSKPKNGPPPVQIFKEQIQSVDKAKGVEQTLEQGAQQRREKTEENEK